MHATLTDLFTEIRMLRKVSRHHIEEIRQDKLCGNSPVSRLICYWSFESRRQVLTALAG